MPTWGLTAKLTVTEDPKGVRFVSIILYDLHVSKKGIIHGARLTSWKLDVVAVLVTEPLRADSTHLQNLHLFLTPLYIVMIFEAIRQTI